MRAACLPVMTCLLAFAAGRPPEIPFDKQPLDPGANETCAFADLNGDGRLDIIAGENWFEAPRWTRRHFRDLNFTNNYIDAFSDLPLNANGDGHVDVITASWFARKLSWWQNPGQGRGEWKEHEIDSGFPIEFAFLVDLDGDGKAREVLPQFGPTKAPVAWYEAKDGAFVKHVVSPASHGHGIGAGDVNGDGRTDILTSKGWFEAPADPRAGPWAWHAEFDLGAVGFMHVLDIDGDGRNDILTAMSHDYGIFWLRRGEGGQWSKQMIDESWSQAHALTVVDLNGDGRPDLLTGKRYMAHNGKDPGEREPLGVYWYESRIEGKQVVWARHVIDYSTRAGGGDRDFAAPGKSGLFLFVNRSR